MKFTIDRESMLKPLMTVRGVIEQRHTLPVLSNILVVARDGVLAFTASDSEVELEARVRVQDCVDGEITVPARKLIDICQALPPTAPVELGLDDDARVHIRCGRSRFALTTLPAMDFPTTDEVADEAVFTIAQNELKRLIELTQFAMARTGCSVLPQRTVARSGPSDDQGGCNGWPQARRGSPRDHDWYGTSRNRFIVPRKGVLELAKLVTAEESRTHGSRWHQRGAVGNRQRSIHQQAHRRQVSGLWKGHPRGRCMRQATFDGQGVAPAVSDTYRLCCRATNIGRFD